MTDLTPAHLAATRIDAPAAFAFAHLSDGRKLGRWTLGSMDLAPTGEPDLWRGQSLFDGAEALVEIRPEPRLGLIDFRLGPAGARVPRVSIRVTPGPDWGLPETSCLAAMTTWRAGWMDDARWMRTVKSHELEVLLFRAQIETDWKAAQ